jgi:hypothetical protein
MPSRSAVARTDASTIPSSEVAVEFDELTNSSEVIAHAEVYGEGARGWPLEQARLGLDSEDLEQESKRQPSSGTPGRACVLVAGGRFETALVRCH